MKALQVGLVGDYSAHVTAHRAVPSALRIASAVLGCEVEETWLPTAGLAEKATIDLSRFQGLWCVPASPYESFDGALRAITYARENNVPFLGTCGGFQHAVIEFARNVLGRPAEHAELNASAAEPLFARLSCSMVEVDARIYLSPGSQLAEIYGCVSVSERYHCNFGMNPAHTSWFDAGPMTVSGVDDEGSARAVEMAGHRFYMGTAFQPERSSLAGQPHPLIVAFVGALSQ